MCYFRLWKYDILENSVIGKGSVFVEITDVRVRKLSEEGRLRSIVSVTLDNCFVIHDIKLIEGENGLFIAMPSKKIADGSFRDIVAVPVICGNDTTVDPDDLCGTLEVGLVDFSSEPVLVPFDHLC